MEEKYRLLLLAFLVLTIVTVAFTKIYAAYPRAQPLTAQEMIPGDPRYWLPDPYELKQKIYNKTGNMYNETPIIIWKETIPNYEVYRSINITTRGNITITIQYNMTKNGTEILIDKKVLVIKNGTVMVDRQLDYAIITSDREMVVIPGNKIEQILKAHERVRERIISTISNKLANTDAYNRILEKLEQIEADIYVLDNSTISINATIPVKVRILFLIPWEVKLQYRETYNVDTGAAVYTINRPWWWFLVTWVEG